MNGNKEIYPLAYSIVDGENQESWEWFLRLLATHVISDLPSVCIISDRHHGIKKAFKEVPQLQQPCVHHRYCLRHLRSNVMTKYKKKRLRSLVWEAGTARKETVWVQAMDNIYDISKSAYNYLMKIEPEKWALCFDGGHRYGIMTTNSSESFNNTLKGVRLLPVTAIARLTFHKLVAQFATRHTSGEEMGATGLTWPKNIFDVMDSRRKLAQNAIVENYNNEVGIYVVSIATPMTSIGQPHCFNVNLEQRTCTCGEWEVDGLPCAHVHAACLYSGRVINLFVPDCFSIDNYRSAYRRTLNPLKPQSEWEEIEFTTDPPKNPRRKNQRGRRHKTRIPNEMDYAVRHR